ncbi:hypothetical protein LCGC14_1483430 [marine sediment metagenome]|uniref:Uncharacterized protein n=1 Tax=marine sediment metagenome TaxID=412755 RepID=A0A0F9J8V6_9ZZZZ
MFYLVNAYIEMTVWYIRQEHLWYINGDTMYNESHLQYRVANIVSLALAPLFWLPYKILFRNDEELKPGWPGDFEGRHRS